MFGSPKVTFFILPAFDLTYTANFFGPPGVLNGLLRFTVIPLCLTSLIYSSSSISIGASKYTSIP
jgi:hypothetical protein